MPRNYTTTLVLLCAFLATACAHSLPVDEPGQAMKDVRCLPPHGQADREGCWILASRRLANSPDARWYWHIYEFPNAEMASGANDSQGDLIEAYGRIYLMAVTTQNWMPGGGHHIATIGPMRTVSPVPHTATFLQSWLVPGMQTRVHMHEGPEALWIVAGEQCVETPNGIIRTSQSEQVVVAAQTPMVLYPVVSGRRALAVIIHPTDQPLSHAHAWQPTGSCLNR